MPAGTTEAETNGDRSDYPDGAPDAAADGEGRAVRRARRERDAQRTAVRPERGVPEPRQAACQALAEDDVACGLRHRGGPELPAAGKRRHAAVAGDAPPAALAEGAPGEPGAIAEQARVEGEVTNAEPAQERLAPGAPLAAIERLQP